MGTGYIYHCKNCNNKYEVFLGMGMMFPSIYKELIEDISKRKYGKEMQLLMKSKQNLAINAEKQVYLCNHCKHWDIEYVLDLYEPNDNYINSDSYVAPFQLKNNYKLLKKYIHKCPNCGKKTHKVSDNNLSTLPCPACNSPLSVSGFVDWD